MLDGLCGSNGLGKPVGRVRCTFLIPTRSSLETYVMNGSGEDLPSDSDGNEGSFDGYLCTFSRQGRLCLLTE